MDEKKKKEANTRCINYQVTIVSTWDSIPKSTSENCTKSFQVVLPTRWWGWGIYPPVTFVTTHMHQAHQRKPSGGASRVTANGNNQCAQKWWEPRKYKQDINRIRYIVKINFKAKSATTGKEHSTKRKISVHKKCNKFIRH